MNKNKINKNKYKMFLTMSELHIVICLPNLVLACPIAN